MKFQQLVTLINDHHPLQVIHSDFDLPIEKIQLITCEMNDFHDHTLYIGTYQQFSDLKEMPKQMLIAYDISELKNTAPYIGQYSNYAYFPEKHLHDIVNLAYDVLLKSFQNISHMNDLISLSLQGNPLSSILDRASSIIRNPLVLVDTTYKVLAYSESYRVQDPMWQDNIQRGYCTLEFLKMATELAPKQTIPNSAEAYSIYCPLSPTSKYGSQVFFENGVIGYLFLFEENEPITFQQKDFLGCVSYIVSEHMGKTSDLSSLRSPLSERLLQHLISGDDASYVKTLMTYTSITFPSQMRCLSLQLTALGKLSGRPESIREEIKFQLNPIGILIQNDYLFCILEEPQTLTKLTQIITELITSKDPYIKQAYVSQSFSDIFNLKTYYYQCESLKNISQHLNSDVDTMVYDDYIYYALLDAIPDKAILLDKVHPALSILKHFDKEHQSELYITLKCYLDLGTNLKETASKLYIHRNTMSYRLKQIEEVTNMTLSDQKNIHLLYLSYRIDEYLE